MKPLKRQIDRDSIDYTHKQVFTANVVWHFVVDTVLLPSRMVLVYLSISNHLTRIDF